ncbi:MAG: hypothetical protein FH753_18405 [Firmicutes bacterium]|nr:hypothetical protein [Bacillota bacterium]
MKMYIFINYFHKDAIHPTAEAVGFSHNNCNFKEVIIDESKGIDEKDILTVVNRWHEELYNESQMKFLPSIVLANMMDPVTYEIIENLDIESIEDKGAVEKIINWANESIIHTQTLDIFKDNPGKDPWGVGNLLPAYKKLLPSEMKAMSIYSGEITGKCSSIARLLSSVFRVSGVKSRNIVLLRMPSHTISLVKIKDIVYLINNQNIMKVNKKLIKDLSELQFIGLYNDSVIVNNNIKITKEIFKSKETLLDSIIKVNNLNISKTDNHLKDKFDRKDLSDMIYKSSNVKFSLAKYAYQSLYVKRPELYLKASLRSPKAFELSNKLNTDEEIFKWIKENIKSGSIFKDFNERIMIADQVIVLKTGGLKDKAILAYSLLKRNGYNPIIKISRKNAYIKYDEKIYDFKNKKMINSIKEEVKLILKD